MHTEFALLALLLAALVIIRNQRNQQKWLAARHDNWNRPMLKQIRDNTEDIKRGYFLQSSKEGENARPE